MTNQNSLETEFSFILPKGLVDSQGQIHRRGVMRLSTAKDEMSIQKDGRVQDDLGVRSYLVWFASGTVD